MRAAGWAVLGLLLLFVVNGCYQVVRKPSEILGLVAPASPKTPGATWAEYAPLARAHATAIVRPELLLALIQVESRGDPFARTYWRWQWSGRPFEIFRPASSAVGILQLTDGAFAEARRLCIQDHAVARAESWLDPRGCWFNALYTRSVPGHAIEMTSAWLHQNVVEVLGATRAAQVAPASAARLAAVIHLCGRGRGVAFSRQGFRARPGERCGDHDLERYLARVERLGRSFARLEAAG